MTPLSSPCAWVTVVTALLVAPAHAADGAPVTRSLLRNELTVKGGREGRFALRKLRPGQTVELGFSRLKLADTWVIEQENVVVRGQKGGRKPVVECPRNKPALVIRASGVVVEDVIFKDCNGTSSVVIVEPKNPTFDGQILISSISFSGVEVTDNQVQDGHLGGGALVVVEASVSVSGSSFRRNIAGSGSGGAIMVAGGLLAVNDSIFRKNVAGHEGGAVYVAGQGKGGKDGLTGLTVSNCTFRSNLALADYPSSPFVDFTGAPLEESVFYNFENVAGQGGAIHADAFTDVAITDSNFVGNEAPNGGAIYFQFHSGGKVPRGANGFAVRGCNFTDNAAVNPSPAIDQQSGIENEQKFYNGGAIFAAIGEGTLRSTIESCTFNQNRAIFGGGLHIVASGTAQVNIRACQFDQNAAKQAGGAAVFRNVGSVFWASSNVTKCTAEIGGGVLLTNNARMMILGPSPFGDNGHVNSVLEGNIAVDGAGLMCAGCGASTFQGPWFLNNTASRNGGGLAVLEAATDVFIQEGRFENNIARRGGGAYVDGAGYLRLFTNPAFKRSAPTRFYRNRAVSGGGLFIVPRSHHRNVMEVLGVMFEENLAYSLEDLKLDLRKVRGTLMNFSTNSLTDAQSDEAGVTKDYFADCGPAGGGGMCLLMDKVPGSSGVAVVLSGIDFIKNVAGFGGGAYFSVSDYEWSPETCQSAFLQTPTSLPCRSFQLRNPKFVQNSAIHGGEGIFVSDPSKLFVERNGGTCDGHRITKSSFRKGGETEVMSLQQVLNQGLAGEFCLVFQKNALLG